MFSLSRRLAINEEVEYEEVMEKCGVKGETGEVKWVGGFSRLMALGPVTVPQLVLTFWSDERRRESSTGTFDFN